MITAAQSLYSAPMKPETVLERLKTYHDQTQPLIDFYRNEGVLTEVDGTKKPDEVLADILGALR